MMTKYSSKLILAGPGPAQLSQPNLYGMFNPMLLLLGSIICTDTFGDVTAIVT